jgi:prepilin-type processing-associated H-X9-DG protein
MLMRDPANIDVAIGSVTYPASSDTNFYLAPSSLCNQPVVTNERNSYIDPAYTPRPFQHFDGYNFSFVDGHVKYLINNRAATSTAATTTTPFTATVFYDPKGTF